MPTLALYLKAERFAQACSLAQPAQRSRPLAPPAPRAGHGIVGTLCLAKEGGIHAVGRQVFLSGPLLQPPGDDLWGKEGVIQSAQEKDVLELLVRPLHSCPQEIDLIGDLHHGAPHHIHTVGDEMHVGPGNKAGEIVKAALTVDMHKVFGLGMQGRNQPLQLLRVGVCRNEVGDVHVRACYLIKVGLYSCNHGVADFLMPSR